MKFLTLSLFLCLLIVALVSAVPIDESFPGDVYDQEQNNPHDPQSIFKLKKLKKLLLG
ncbi:uncharacterized protein LOC119673351 [Teleopsis dalmanni]|uniref:uncharacterized protein LOC119673350 n=1 Tax=Teleopsis dalmanni TaxID=139649 RepID=UPI0018CD365E|nr:uncharacterized protein LOC119673350 [Teleopsis dalmanni]XP_037940543.1 uncharacterized protein LOC119673351 [Teleopsis dalmanni]